jgi:DNA-binding transcriptional MerR regulator
MRRLAFIRHSRELGFEVDAIRTLLTLQDEPNHSCVAADQIARARLADVTQRLTSLEALKRELERMVAGCVEGKVAECRVIEVLADHGQCSNAQHARAKGPLGRRRVIGALK